MASSSSSPKLYDVFINHRGPDVKRTLALALYKSLQKIGIRVFLDSEEMESGYSYPSPIFTAIRSASVHITIFSKRYAESAWCLNELVLMLQSKAKILPVFYDVEPWELRYIEKGAYADAFINFEKRGRYLDKLKDWKEALQSVSFITGWEFGYRSDQQTLFDEIVSSVRKEIKDTSLVVAKYPVGLDVLVSDFGKQWQQKEEKANIIGIFGMAGCGKTTLAKELYNRLLSKFDGSCFLFDVREANVKCELTSLLAKLVKDLFLENFTDIPKFQSTSEGTMYLPKRLRMGRSLRYLIVLDDIDHIDQLDALLPTYALSFGSLALVTTSDERVLINAGITVRYKMKEMDRDHSRELFCWHAFDRPVPEPGYEGLVESFLKECGGLPLSLEVLGGQLYGIDDEFYWRLHLDKVRKMLPADIKKRLKVSFDALDREEREIFMDIGCFFIGQSKAMAIRIWQASGWSAEHALQTLKHKCLVEVMEEGMNESKELEYDDGLVIRVHNHLGQLGREVADERICRPRRLWRTEDLKFWEFTGLQKILVETKGQSLRCFNSVSDWSIRITYFLKSSDGYAETVLLWLELNLEDKLLTCIPPWIPLQHLQGLKIFNGGLKMLWQSPLQAPLQLKRLVLYGISSLEELKSIEMLLFFEDLLLSGDLLLTATMVMEGTSLSESLRKLTNLKLLVLRHFTLNGELSLTDGGKPSFPEPPKSSELEKIDIIAGKPSFPEVPKSSQLEKKEIIAGKSSFPEPPNSSQLEKIEIIAVELVSKVSVCGNHCPNLKSLKISGMEDLLEIDLTGLKTLNCLKLEYCTELKTVSGICDLENLVTLYLLDCPKLKTLPSLAHMSLLERIMVDKCPKIQNIEGIEELKGVKYLHLSTADGSISDGAVWNCIHALQRLPSITIVIGRAVYEAELALNSDLFSDMNEPTAITDIQMIAKGKIDPATAIDIPIMSEKGKATETLEKPQSVILCAVVECHESLDIEIPFLADHSIASTLRSRLPVGEWVVTIAIGGDTGITYAPHYIAQSSWISKQGHNDPEIKKGYLLAVKEGEGWQASFKTIMAKLYHGASQL